MTRTVLVNHDTAAKLLYVSDTHDRQTAIERAMQHAGYVGTNDEPVTSFHFDLVDFVRDIKVKRLKDDVLSRLTFSVDAYIQGALSRMLNEYYKHSKQDVANPTFANYAEFLRHIEGIEASEEALYEAGCDVHPSVERLHNLLDLRNELHGVIAGQLSDPSAYVTPQLADILATPKMRSLSAQAEQGLVSICEDDTDDEELRAELFAQYKLDDQLERMNQHRMDTMKAKSLIMLLNCVNHAEHTPSEDDDAFYSTDTRTQFGLLNTTMRAIVDTRRRAVTDNRLSVMEKAALRVEAKALIATLTTTLEHSVFATTVD